MDARAASAPESCSVEDEDKTKKKNRNNLAEGKREDGQQETRTNNHRK